ncbi:MAG: threonine--tRNA ligase, partial [Verrucomicrobia bacterium]
AAIIDELEKLARETEFAAGYQRVRTPHIAREILYKKSGHLPYYAESMFPPMQLKREGKDVDVKRQRFEALNAIVEAKKETPEQYREFKELQHELLDSDKYYLKAMNCPHHHKLFAAVPRSYRDLPLRLAEYGT